MRTKRGGFKHTKNPEGKPRVRIRARAGAPKQPPDKVRLAAVSGRDDAWKGWGSEVLLEPTKAGLYRILARRAPSYLWAQPKP